MRVAIVGGAGFVGHHLALRLGSLGHEVLVVDALIVNNRYQMPVDPKARRWRRMLDERMLLLNRAGIEVSNADARDYHMLSRVAGDFRPDALVHLAAVAHIDRANKDPATTFDHSLRTLENSLDVARALGGVHLIYFSSSTAYGPFPSPVIDETCPQNPQGIYGSLKSAGELMVRAYGDVYSMPATIVRPQALYGPRCISGRVIQKWIEAAFDREPIRVDGDGTARHDFTHVDDAVQGVLLMLGNPRAFGEAFNITAGNAVPLARVIGIVGDSFGDLQVSYGPPDPERPSRGTMAIGKARRLLGYAPAWPIERGIADYVGWYREFFAADWTESAKIA